MRIIKLGRFPGDPIGSEYLSPEILKDAKTLFKKMEKESHEPITFRFGDVREAAVLESLNLVETVIRSEIEAISETEYYLASGGPIVYFVGKKRIATFKAFFSFHSFIYQVKSSWILDRVQFPLLKKRMKRHNRRFEKILHLRTEMSEEDIQNIVRRVKGRLEYNCLMAYEVKIVTEIKDTLD
jgi:hypothetical protein